VTGATRPPLEGVRVVELGTVIAGTYGGMLLAELGADVIKVEPPTGDPGRNPGIAPYRDESAIHLHMNRGKRSVSVDLKSPPGLGVFEDLIRSADACTDNMRPGALERLGLGFDRLRELNPKLVCCSVSGFGGSGPKRSYPAYDVVIQAISGHMHITGEPDGAPARIGAPMADLGGGLFTCIAVLAGTVAVRGGQAPGPADISMLDSLVSLLGYDSLLYLNAGIEAERRGSAHAYMVPWQAFEVADGYIVIAAREDKFWARLCQAIGRPELADDPRTATNRARLANRELVIDALNSVLPARDTDHWLSTFAEYDIPAAPVNDLGGVFSDAQIAARDVVGTYDHPTLGAVRFAGGPVRFGEASPPQRHAPMLGEHSEQVLGETLGYSDDRIAQLIREGAVRTWTGET
jgi:crotonobetainyl-CoA:carnitine CoA-transferase CaiB-like acyl-CoA transferase